MLDLGSLRKIEEKDIHLILNWRNSPSVRANMFTQHEISMDEHLEWWEKTKKQKDQIYLIYESRKTPMGVISFNSIDPHNKHSFWAFYAAPDAPKGIGTLMEFAALNYGFDILNLHKLSCEVLAFNEKVIRLHEKFSFKIEGIFREQKQLNGKFVDLYRLGLLSREWIKHRHSIESKIRISSK